jgi:hypothetical protein
MIECETHSYAVAKRHQKLEKGTNAGNLYRSI